MEVLLKVALLLSILTLSAQNCEASPIEFPYDRQQVQKRVSKGLGNIIDLAHSTHALRVGLWQQGARPTYKIVSSQMFFYGIFESYLSDVARATNVGINLASEPRASPDILVVMDYRLKSWTDVAEFLTKHEEVGFGEKIEAAKLNAFSGCTADVINISGRSKRALIVVDLAHPVVQVKTCLYKLSFQLFGYSPSGGSGHDPYAMALDLAVAAALYQMKDEQLAPEQVETEILTKLGQRR